MSDEMENIYYPVFLDLRNRLCVVVGGGKVAARKVESLVKAGARVKVISPEVDDEIVIMGGVSVHKRPYTKGDLAGAFLVIAATDNHMENLGVSKEADECNVICNVVDQIDLCSFIVPSVVEKGPIKIAISTGGASPALARKLRNNIGQLIGKEFETLARILARIRPVVISRGADADIRGRIFNVLVDSLLIDAIKKGDKSQVEDIIYQALGTHVELDDIL